MSQQVLAFDAKMLGNALRHHHPLSEKITKILNESL